MIASSSAASSSASPTITTAGRPTERGQVAHAADDLAVEALRVEVPLAGDDHVGGARPLLQVDVLGDELEAADEPAAERGEAAGEPTRGAGAVELGHVDAELLAVAGGELLEPRRQQGDLRRAGALLRSEHGRRVDEASAHVAGHLQLHRPQPRRAGERLDGTAPAVRRRRAAQADDDAPGALLDRPGDQLAGAGGGRGERIVALGAAGEGEAAGSGHLDHGGAMLETPGRRDRAAERPGDDRRAVGAAEHVEQALAAVGHRRLVGVVAELPAGVGDRPRRLRRRGRAPELVEPRSAPASPSRLDARILIGPVGFRSWP